MTEPDGQAPDTKAPASEPWFSNMKRTYDDYLQESLETIRRNRLHFDKMFSDAQALTTQMMQQAISTAGATAEARMVNIDALTKQMIRNTALSVDRQWNVDEVSGLVAKTPVQLDALAAAIAAAVVAALNPPPKSE